MRVPTKQQSLEELRTTIASEELLEPRAVPLRVQCVRRELLELHRSWRAVREQCVERPDAHATDSGGVAPDRREHRLSRIQPDLRIQTRSENDSDIEAIRLLTFTCTEHV